MQGCEALQFFAVWSVLLFIWAEKPGISFMEDHTMAIKTISLSGTEVAVTGLDGSNAHIRNDGTDVIYASKTAGAAPGADGTASIPAGQSDTIRGINKTLYLTGTGSVLVQTDDYIENPFKTSAQAGGSGADDVARAALTAHAANTDIHVSSAEKESWNGKAEPSAIPAKLQYINYLGYVSDVNRTLNNPNYSECSYECIITTAEAALIGLPSCWWQIKYLRHTDNNGFGCQIAFPIDGPDNSPRYRTSAGLAWADWKLLCDGGNAETLDSHPAGDFVMRDEFSELSDKVNSLVAGSSTTSD